MTKRLDPARRALEVTLAASEGEREASLHRLKSELRSRKRVPLAPARGEDAAAASFAGALRKALGS